MSTSAAKDPAVIVGNVQLTECDNGDCVIQLDDFSGGHGVLVGRDYVYGRPIHIPKANRNTIAEFLKV